MDKRRNGREKLFGLADDLKDWMQLLEIEGRDDAQPIWSDSTTEDVVNLVEELFQEFEEDFKLASGKINEAEKEGLEEIRIKTQKFLNSYGKEHQI